MVFISLGTEHSPWWYSPWFVHDPPPVRPGSVVQDFHLVVDPLSSGPRLLLEVVAVALIFKGDSALVVGFFVELPAQFRVVSRGRLPLGFLVY